MHMQTILRALIFTSIWPQWLTSLNTCLMLIMGLLARKCLISSIIASNSCMKVSPILIKCTASKESVSYSTMISPMLASIISSWQIATSSAYILVEAPRYLEKLVIHLPNSSQISPPIFTCLRLPNKLPSALIFRVPCLGFIHWTSLSFRVSDDMGLEKTMMQT